MSQVLEVVHYLRSLPIHPLGGVIFAALLAALVEQRMARRRTPDFSTAFRDISGPPQAPPPTDQTPRR
ncbi:hypothetical protein [Phenylobacterium sp.]|uniref:hypothetical protein n=1 Tax=Phenylobacterium sp. TaxID=1871053 RepID=UPI00374D59FB